MKSYIFDPFLKITVLRNYCSVGIGLNIEFTKRQFVISIILLFLHIVLLFSCMSLSSLFSSTSPSSFLPLSHQAWRPKTLLQHLKLRSKSGQMWRLTLAQVSVQHPHTPQSRFAHFRCSAGAEGDGALTPGIGLTFLNWRLKLPPSHSHPTFSSLEINVPPLPAPHFASPVEPINPTGTPDSQNYKPEKAKHQ